MPMILPGRELEGKIMPSKKPEHKKGRLVTPGYRSAIEKSKGVSRADMAKFKHALNEHEATQSIQAQGEAHMQFVSDLVSEIQPLRFKHLSELNAGQKTKLTFSDLKDKGIEQPIEKCIREYCTAANAINKAQKPAVQKGAGSLAVYTKESIDKLDQLKTKFINDVTALKPAPTSSKDIKTSMKEKVQATLSPQKSTSAEQYSKSLHTVAINVIAKHNLDQSKNLPTPPSRPRST